MAEEHRMSGGNIAWNAINTILGLVGVGGLATAIPAAVMADNAEDRERRRGRGRGRDYGYDDYEGEGHGDCHKVSRYELKQTQEIAELKAEKCANENLSKAVAALASGFERKIDCLEEKQDKLFVESCVEKERNEWQMKFVNKGFAEQAEETRELKKRVDAITKEVVPISAICPQPLSGCVPLHMDGRVVDTRDEDKVVKVIEKVIIREKDDEDKRKRGGRGGED